MDFVLCTVAALVLLLFSIVTLLVVTNSCANFFVPSLRVLCRVKFIFSTEYTLSLSGVTLRTRLFGVCCLFFIYLSVALRFCCMRCDFASVD